MSTSTDSPAVWESKRRHCHWALMSARKDGTGLPVVVDLFYREHQAETAAKRARKTPGELYYFVEVWL